MARKRMIDPGLWTDEDLGQLPIELRLLFIGLISQADDEGFVPANPAYLRAAIFPYDDLTTAKVELLRDKLVGAMGSIELCQAEDGKEYIRLINWTLYQRIDRPSPSKVKVVGTPKRAIPAEARRELARRYGAHKRGDRVEAKCHYCGAIGKVSWITESWVWFDKLEIDHVVPESAGGSNGAENLVLACRKCNRSRGQTVIAGNSSNTSRKLVDDRSAMERNRREGKRARGDDESDTPPSSSKELVDSWYRLFASRTAILLEPGPEQYKQGAGVWKRGPPDKLSAAVLAYFDLDLWFTRPKRGSKREWSFANFAAHLDDLFSALAESPGKRASKGPTVKHCPKGHPYAIEDGVCMECGWKPGDTEEDDGPDFGTR